jgi:hypothetical protein
MNSRQLPISNRAQFVQLTRQKRIAILYYAECSIARRAKREAQGFSPWNAYATKSPSKGARCDMKRLL